MKYFVKRNEKINGPFSLTQTKAGIKSGKLRDSDLIGSSTDGPWQLLSQVMGKSDTSTVEVESDKIANADHFSTAREDSYTLEPQEDQGTRQGTFDGRSLPALQPSTSTPLKPPSKKRKGKRTSQTDRTAALFELDSLRKKSVGEHELSQFAKGSMVDAAMTHNSHVLSALATGGPATSDLDMRKGRVDATVDAYAALQGDAEKTKKKALVRQASLETLLDVKKTWPNLFVRLGFELSITAIGLLTMLVALPLMLVSYQVFLITILIVVSASGVTYLKLKPLKQAMMDYPRIRKFKRGRWPRDKANMMVTWVVVSANVVLIAIAFWLALNSG